MAQKAREIGKSYNPMPLEDKWYERWLESGIFHSEPDDKRDPFCIVIPPPNVTGSLHMGHALNNTLQDISCRYKRMAGYNVMWLPGTDHAGIATQNVVERKLQEEGKTRHDLGRDAFVQRVWEWKEEYGSRIINQLKKLGASCDWERERFTMDEGLSRAVRAVFVRLYKEGLIYKGKYIINWCPRCHTALSDLEVEHTPQKGKLYHVLYPFADGSEGGVVVATTRPETILGDVAIAVHPRDERNANYIGEKVVVPLCNRVISIIEDNMVDPEFGTGLVKITPAHDPNDFLVGQRQNLPQIQVIDENGKMNEEAGSAFVGLDRFEAREKIVKMLKDAGLLVEVVEHEHSVGTCYRCGTVIEPYLSEQWFVRTKPLAEEGIKAVKERKIEIIPEQWENTYFQWMENIRDWCISRQLWWGHRIPAWTCSDCGHVTVSEEDPTCCEKCQSKNISQDEDVLDTWFSSALWPFSTLGWPEETEDLKYYYPTSLLVTGFDILFFWVARMIMMGLKFMKDVPFRHVYIHALVRDEHGQKMSKSKGNVIDPLEIIDVYGADALRMTLAALTVQGRDIYLSKERIETYRHFLNKIWNAARFALMNTADFEENRMADLDLRIHDTWIKSKLGKVTKSVTEYLEGYYYGEAARLLYDFVWSDLCDWYLEMAKPALRGDEGELRRRTTQKVLLDVFRDVIKLLHPFIPFVTEELWHAFDFSDQFLEKENWPEVHGFVEEQDAEKNMDTLQSIVRDIRNLRAEARLAPQEKVPECYLFVKDSKDLQFVRENEDIIKLLTKVENIKFIEQDSSKPSKALASVSDYGEAFLVVDGIIDITEEIKRLEKEKNSVLEAIKKSESKLNNEKFLANAPAEIVEKEKKRLEDNKEKLKRIEMNLERFR